jgi:hypothetical protein
MERPVEHGIGQSARAFVSSGVRHAQFAFVVLVAIGGVFTAGVFTAGAKSNKAIEIEIQRIKENAAAEIAQLQAEAGRARAKAIQETRENS